MIGNIIKNDNVWEIHGNMKVGNTSGMDIIQEWGKESV